MDLRGKERAINANIMQLSSDHVFIISPLEQKLSYKVHTGLSWVEPNIWLFAETIVGPGVHAVHW